MAETWLGKDGEPEVVLKLSDLRGQLIRQEETIIFALIERAQFAANPAVYRKDAGKLVGVENPKAIHNFKDTSFLDYMLCETEKLHSLVRRYTAPDEHAFFPDVVPDPILPGFNTPRLIKANGINIGQKIKSIYENKIIQRMSTDHNDDGNYGSCTVCDIAALQALSKRIHFGKFIAEAKFSAERERYTKLITTRDAEGIMRELTKPTVEKQVCERVRLKASTYGRDPLLPDEPYKIHPDVIMELYRDWVMPLTKEVQVAYLLQRLDSCEVAFVGFPRPLELTVVSAAERAARDCLERDRGKVATTILSYKAKGTIQDVIAAVTTNKAHYGVVDIESSDFGINRVALRTLMESELSITHEHFRMVRSSGVVLDTTVWPPVGPCRAYGTRETLARASTWIFSTLSAATQQIVVSSDGEAIHAIRIAKENASVCSVAIIEVADDNDLASFGLRDVDTLKGQMSRIRSVVLEKSTVGPSGKDRTAVSFELSNPTSPGQLSTTLELFKSHQVNLALIQSLAPSKQDEAFCFYIEVDGHFEDVTVAGALAGLRELTSSICVLGSYMRSTNKPVVRTNTKKQQLQCVTVDPSSPVKGESDAGVAFLGPLATYSHQAVCTIFPEKETVLKPCAGFAEVFESVIKGTARVAVVPVENSTAGLVKETLAGLIKNSDVLTVIGEHTIDIEHCLLSTVPLADITEVHSKAEALSQCSKWLKELLPNVKLVACQSSAHAASIAKDKTNSIAAIASSLAAERNGVEAVCRSIQDDNTNATRFIVLANKSQPHADADADAFSGSPQATSLYVCSNVASIAEVLNAFARRRITIKSFLTTPSTTGAWRQDMVIDCEGHVKDALVSEAFKEIQELCETVCWLGSYPCQVVTE